MAHDGIELHAGHQNVVSSIAFPADGRTLVSGGWDGAVKLWDVRTGSLLRTFDPGWSQVDAVSVSPDGKVVVAGGSFEDIQGSLSEVRVWASDTGELVAAIDAEATAFAFSPDGGEIYGFFFTALDPAEEEGRPPWARCGVSSPEVIVWDASTGAERARLTEDDERVRLVCRRKPDASNFKHGWILMPDGDRALRVADDSSPARGSLELWGSSGDAPLWRLSLPGEEFLCAAVSPNATRVASGGRTGAVRLHDPGGGRVVAEWTGHEGWVRAVEFSPDGSLLASAGDDGTVRLWDVQDERPVMVLGSPRNGVKRVAFSPDGSTLVSAGEDHALRMWDTGKLALRASLFGHEKKITAVAYSPDGGALATGSMDGTVRLWDGMTGESRRTLAAHEAGVLSLAFSADGSEVVTFGAGADDPLHGEIGSWSVRSGELRRKQPIPAYASLWRPNSLSSDARLLATCEYDPHEVSLWDVRSGSLLMSLRYDKDMISSLDFSPDGETLFGGCQGFRAVLWDTRSGDQTCALRLHRDSPSSVAFEPGGGSLVLGTDYANWVTRWDLKTGNLVRTFTGHRHAVRSVAFRGDGRMFASGGDDGTVILWEPDGGRSLASLVMLPPTDGQGVSHDWVAFGTGGGFHASPGARRFLRRRVGDGLVPVEGWSFEEWVRYVFDHPVTEPEWHFAEDAATWEDRFQDTVPFLTRLFEDPGCLLDRYTPGQISQGLWFLVSSGCSDHAVALLDGSVPWSLRRRCIGSIATLFGTLFAAVCTDHLSHLDRGPTPPASVSPVNLVCYMWWDLFPTSGEPDDPTRAGVDAAVLGVLRTTLSLPSVACRESALHGLGHWHDRYPARVEAVVDEFLASGPVISPELREYALRARTGGVL